MPDTPDLTSTAVSNGPASAFLLDPRSRRAWNEAVLDGQYELQQARTAVARMAGHGRLNLALARVVFASVPREVATLPFGTFAFRVGLIGILLFGIAAWTSSDVFRVYSEWAPTPAWLIDFLAAPILLLWQTVLLPAIFLALIWPARRPVSAVGAAVAAACLYWTCSALSVIAIWHAADAKNQVLIVIRQVPVEAIRPARLSLSALMLQPPMFMVASLAFFATLVIAPSPLIRRLMWTVGLPCATVVVLAALWWLRKPLMSPALLAAFIVTAAAAVLKTTQRQD